MSGFEVSLLVVVFMSLVTTHLAAYQRGRVSALRDVRKMVNEIAQDQSEAK